MIQGALAFIRVVVWVWDPSWDDSSSELQAPNMRYRLWYYDLSETRLVALWASLRRESPAWLPSGSPPLSTQLSIPEWALPAFRPYNQNPEQMFKLARSLSSDYSGWNESHVVLQNAERFWDMPSGLFMAWVFAYSDLDSTFIDGLGKCFSCRVIKDKQSELHFFPFCHDIYPRWTLNQVRENPSGIRVFGVPSNHGRCVFALDEVSDLGSNRIYLGSDIMDLSQVSWSDVEKMFETMDIMWKSLDPILKAVQSRPPTP